MQKDKKNKENTLSTYLFLLKKTKFCNIIYKYFDKMGKVDKWILVLLFQLIMSEKQFKEL